MKIYTKTGDTGETVLYGGESVSKDHPRLLAYGSIDELNSVIGWLRAAGLDEDLDEVMHRAQNQLFAIGAELASPDRKRLEGRHEAVNEADVIAMEKQIDRWEAELAPIKNFILPGGTEAAARAHCVRTVTRRAERYVVSLKRKVEVTPVIIRYLNRFSDLAFVLARVINQRAAVPDIEWQKN